MQKLNGLSIDPVLHLDLGWMPSCQRTHTPCTFAGQPAGKRRWVKWHTVAAPVERKRANSPCLDTSPYQYTTSADPSGHRLRIAQAIYAAHDQSGVASSGLFTGGWVRAPSGICRCCRLQRREEAATVGDACVNMLIAVPLAALCADTPGPFPRLLASMSPIAEPAHDRSKSPILLSSSTWMYVPRLTAFGEHSNRRPEPHCTTWGQSQGGTVRGAASPHGCTLGATVRSLWRAV